MIREDGVIYGKNNDLSKEVKEKDAKRYDKLKVELGI